MPGNTPDRRQHAIATGDREHWRISCMPNITVYGPSRAPFVLKVRGALALKKLDAKYVEPSGPEDYQRWNPENGLLPVIDVDGERVHDSSRILDFLDERFPEPPLESRDSKVANSQRRLESWVEEAFMFYWVNYLRDLVNREEESEEAAGQGGRRRRMRRRAAASRSDQGLGAEFVRRLDDLVNFLGARPFYYADQLSRADLAVYSFLLNIPDAAGPGVSSEVAARPALQQHLDRVEQVLTGTLV